MDDIVTKALIIGVSIFVTLIVATVLILEFTQIKDIYRGVAETNIRFEDRLNEFDKYKDSNNYFNGLDVKNTIEKYKNDEGVQVCVISGGNMVCDDTLEIAEEKYKEEYKSYIDEENSILKIVFEEE